MNTSPTKLSNQQRQIIECVYQRGSITTLEAMRLDKPICRLSERIRELEAKGWRFEHYVPDKTKHYTRYVLVSAPAPEQIEMFAVA